MRRVPAWMVIFTTAALVTGCSSAATTAPTTAPTAASASAATTAPTAEASATTAPSATVEEAWNQSDIFKGFDPMTRRPDGLHAGAERRALDECRGRTRSDACLRRADQEPEPEARLPERAAQESPGWRPSRRACARGPRKYGINVATTAATDFDPAKEAAAVETVMAAKPDILITIPVDPAAGAGGLQARPRCRHHDRLLRQPRRRLDRRQPVRRRSAPAITTGWARTRPICSPRRSAGPGTYGFIQLDVVFYNSNNREKGFLAEMAQKYPNIKNVAWAGFTDAATVGAATDAMLTQHPEPRRDLHLLQRRGCRGSSPRSRPPATRTSRSSRTTSTPPTTSSWPRRAATTTGPRSSTPTTKARTRSRPPC